MKLLGFFNLAKNKCNMNREAGLFVSAIIVAAGRSERMGTGSSKQLISLGGITAIARTISAFEENPYVNEIIVVTNRIDIIKIGGVVNEFGFEKVKRIIVGGATRQKSVTVGFNAMSGEAAFVAVHDGARPLITSECIGRVIENAIKSGAAAAAVKVKDTIKVADENGIVLSTPERQMLWAVQTPQVFAVELYKKALEASELTGADYTDDCQLIEAAGGRVQLVEGEYSNFKITTADDITQAEAVIRARGDAL
jgi:2-C-methyl-D-erythritol 4-phosphate cytidylyltransferase